MRRFSALSSIVLAILLLGSFSCTRKERENGTGPAGGDLGAGPAPAAPGGGSTPAPAPSVKEWRPAPPEGKAIAGREIVTAADGAWTIRRAGAGHRGALPAGAVVSPVPYPTASAAPGEEAVLAMPGGGGAAGAFAEDEYETTDLDATLAAGREPPEAAAPVSRGGRVLERKAEMEVRAHAGEVEELRPEIAAGRGTGFAVADGGLASGSGAPESVGPPASKAEPASDEDLEVASKPASEATGAALEAARSSLKRRSAAAGAGPGYVPMRAGKTDDNEEYEKFLEYLADISNRGDLAGRIDPLDVRDRKWIRVVNEEGKPVPGARLLVVDEEADRVLASATTYGDGRAPYYPHVRAGEAEKPPAEAAPGRSLLVQVRWGDARAVARWDGASEELTVTLDVPEPINDPISLDVLFLIDTTGSMSDEIGRIKGTLLEVTRRLRNLDREFDLRYGAVLYRDIGDEYITSSHPFTGEIEAFDEALRAVTATGGGDGPESLNQGLSVAVNDMGWREGAAKVMFLIADAPPHLDYSGDIPYGRSLVRALDRGVRIHSVAASGLDPAGSCVFRQVAQFTRGKFIFIEYGSRARSAESHGVKGSSSSNNLDEILYEEIREEVAGWGRV